MNINKIDEIKITLRDGHLSMDLIGVDTTGLPVGITKAEYVRKILTEVIRLAAQSPGADEVANVTRLHTPTLPEL